MTSKIKDPRIKYNLSVSPEMMEKLKEISDEQHTSVNSTIQKAIKLYFLLLENSNSKNFTMTVGVGDGIIEKRFEIIK